MFLIGSGEVDGLVVRPGSDGGDFFRRYIGLDGEGPGSDDIVIGLPACEYGKQAVVQSAIVVLTTTHCHLNKAKAAIFTRKGQPLCKWSLTQLL